MNMTNTSGAFCQTGPLGQGYVMGPYFTPSYYDDPNVYCTLLWFQPWTLDTQTKYVFAVIGVFILSALVALAPGVQIPKDDLLVHRVQRTILYGIQKFAAYMIMLVTMTYDTWLFMAVLFGLMAGHFVLISYVVPAGPTKGGGLSEPFNSDDTPCCQC